MLTAAAAAAADTYRPPSVVKCVYAFLYCVYAPIDIDRRVPSRERTIPPANLSVMMMAAVMAVVVVVVVCPITHFDTSVCAGECVT